MHELALSANFVPASLSILYHLSSFPLQTTTTHMRREMAENEQSRLLKLPRELRDDIYSLVGVTHELTPKSAESEAARLLLTKGLNLSLLLTCRKIHEEYKQTWVQNPGHLSIFINSRHRLGLTLSDLALPPTFPTEALQHVRFCKLALKLGTLAGTVDQEQLMDFARAAEGMRSTELLALPWSPSKGSFYWSLNHHRALISS